MTASILPPHRWGELKGTELETILPFLDPAQTRVLVVERDGEILGCWSMSFQVHLEGAWVKPELRKRGRVLATLIAAMRKMAREIFGVRYVWTASVEPEVTALLTKHLHAQKFAAETYVVGV